jgi:TRAP-type C4-dicarboxylate transport system permease small subunit
MTKSTSGLWNKIETIIEGLSKITGFLGAFALLAAALIVTEGVVIRKVLGWSTTWQIELSVFLLIYACFVGAAYAQINEHHLNVDLMIIHLPSRAREIVLLITAIISACVCVIMAVYSWPMWWESLIRNEHSESLWGPPLWIPYLFLPLGMTLLFLQYLVHIAKKIRLLRSGAYEKEAVRTELKEIEIPSTDNKSEEGA